MKESNTDKLWTKHNLTRREFLRQFGIASSAITLSPFFLDRLARVCEASDSITKVFLVKNGDCFQNTARVWDMLGGPSRYISANDVVVIKGNAQWPYQGYTHTGCIKGVIDKILAIPGFAGEVIICDDVQAYGGPWGFEATPDARAHNWPDHNWNSLAAEYQANGKPVATKRWLNGCPEGWSGPADYEGWVRSFFPFYGRDSFLSYPVFESPLTPGRMIDMRNGVWENGSYTGQRVKAIFMPNLNNHGWGGSDFAGVTSAVKCFFGATEIPNGSSGTVNGSYNMHGTSYDRGRADYAGELTAQYIRTLYAPVLYITAAMWSGHESRTGAATETKTVLACENPATLDYVACKYVISPYAPYLDPDQDNNTRRQILGCVGGGVGTINPADFEIASFDFSNPSYSRLDIERKIRDVKAGIAPEQEAKDMIEAYMENE